jgi:hypothetical protein
MPIPPWLPELAVAAAGKRLTENGVLEPVPPEKFLQLKAHLMESPARDFYTRWAKRVLGDGSKGLLDATPPASNTRKP